MNTGFQELTDEQFIKALEDCIFPLLLRVLKERQPGHCMRVTDLEQPLMAAIARRLRGEGTNALVHILGEPDAEAADDLIISSTKLVELRNPPRRRRSPPAGISFRAAQPAFERGGLDRRGHF